MNCPQCNTPGRKDDLYCRKCGTALARQAAENAAGTAHDRTQPIEKLFEEQLETFKKELRFIQIETISNINKKTENHIQTYFKRIGLALVMVIPVLGFFGYKSYSDIDRFIQGKLSDLDKDVQEAELNMQKQLDDINAGSAALKEKQAQFNNTYQIESIIQKIDSLNKMHSNATAMLSSINANLSRTGQRLSEADQSLKVATGLQANYGKIMNSFYEVVIQTNNEETKGQIQSLVETLSNDGFKINDSNVLTGIEVDRTEVLYYNRDSEEKAVAIAKWMTDSVELNARAHHIQNTDMHPSLIMIKVRIQ